MFGRVTAVGVHLADDVIALHQRPVEPSHVSRPQPLLLCPVQDLQARLFKPQLLNQVTGAIGAAVVDDQYIQLQGLAPQPLKEDRKALDLVVGRNADEDSRG